MRAEIPVMSKP